MNFNNWQLTKLDEITEKITKGATPTSYGYQYQESGINFVKIENIDNYKVQKDTISQYISEDAHKFQSRSSLKNEDLLYGIAGSIGKLAIVDQTCLPANTNQALAIIRSDRTKIDPEFLLFYLSSSNLASTRNKARGGAMNNISLQDIRDIEIKLPSIPEQKQIVLKIKEYFTLLDKSEAKLRLAEEKLDKVMDSAIVKYIEEEGKSKEWDFKSIKDICEINPSKTEIKELPLNTKVAFVQMSSVSDKTGTIEIQEIRTLEEVKKGYTYFKKGDVIFAKITPCMENGKTSLTDNLETKYGFGSTEFHVLRVNNQKIIAEYLYIILRSQRFRKLAMTNMTGTAGQKRLPKDYLAEYKIYVPSIEEQQNIVTKLHKIEAERTNYNSIYEKSLSRLSNLRQSILKKAFEGKLI